MPTSLRIPRIVAAALAASLAGTAGAYTENVDGGSGTVTITLGAFGESVTLTPDTVNDELDVNGTGVAGITLTAINVVIVEGGDGDDTILVDDAGDVLHGTNGIAITLQGGDGTDTITGGPGAETIEDLHGLLAPATGGTIDAGAGSDTVRISGGASGSNSGGVTITLSDGTGSATIDNSDADPTLSISGAELLEYENDFDLVGTTAGNQVVVLDDTAGGNTIGVNLGTDTGSAGALLPAVALRNIAVDASVTFQSSTANNAYDVADAGGLDDANCLPSVDSIRVDSPSDAFATVVCEDGNAFSYDGVSGTDVLTLLGYSTTGENGGVDEVADGSDTFTISNLQVASSNATLGALATLLYSNVDTLGLLAGNEASGAPGDDVEILDPHFATPALDLDGQNPVDLPGDQIDWNHNLQIAFQINFETAVPVGLVELELD